MKNYNNYSYPQRLSYQLLMILLIGFFIIVGSSVLVPIYFSILLAILLLLVTNFLEKIYIPATHANFIAVIAALAVIAGIIYFLSAQMAIFLNDIGSSKTHLLKHIETFAKTEA